MNTPGKPDNRKFRSRNKLAGGRDPHFNITNLYRYEDYFQNPSEALDLFSRIPFLNGGLFECLDKPDKDDPSRILRIDGFSDRDDNELCVPDFLFFSEEHEVDLNEEYGTKNKRYKVRGLIDILNHYKFTIEENTPIEKEIALDPELLGKVFENLLANYNPETKTTARKQTGSYYTPREIVNYMVDESLVAYLETCLKENIPSLADMEELPELLREVFAYTEKIHPFNEEEVTALIDAIYNIKVLDPACGSAAFPMGILHKLVFILGKLDPQNELWKKKQLAKAAEISDITIREKLIEDIAESFECNELDYGRKLSLIENCIYGVDIQPIAVQIAKLRFFISLVVDQKLDDSRQNRGVLPLPNLETKFVAANTLLGIEKPKQMTFRNPEIDKKEAELIEVRRSHFGARTPRTKAKYRNLDMQLRTEISALLLQEEWIAPDTAKKLAYWDPYDQNMSADFFDMEWMFGINSGADIVIANPPYVSINALSSQNNPLIDFLRGGSASLSDYYGVNLHSVPNNQKKYPPKPNLYAFFFVIANKIAREGGLINFIAPRGILTAKDLDTLRYFFVNSNCVSQIVTFKERVFYHKETTAGEIATSSLIIVLEKREGTKCRQVKVANITLDEIHNPRFDYIKSEALSANLENWNFITFDPILSNLVHKYNTNDTADIYYEHSNTGRPSEHSFYFDVGFILDNHLIVKDINPAEEDKYYRLFRSKGLRQRVLETEGFYPRDQSKIQLTKNTQGYVVLNQKYKIVWSVKNPSLFSFSEEEIIFPMGRAAIIASNDREEMLYLLSLLNSRISWLVFRLLMMSEGEKDFLLPISAIKTYLRIPKIRQSSSRLCKARVIDIAAKMLALTKNDDYPSNPAKQADVEKLECQIDQMVYELYGLTREEIAVVEGTRGASIELQKPVG